MIDFIKTNFLQGTLAAHRVCAPQKLLILTRRNGKNVNKYFISIIFIIKIEVYKLLDSSKRAACCLRSKDICYL